MKQESRTRIFRLLFVVLLLSTLVACGPFLMSVDELQTQGEMVELGEASEAEVEVEMGAGRLNVTGGADALLDGEFAFNVDEWAPEVDYEVQGDTGRLVVAQPEAGELTLAADVENTWDLQFNNEVPTEMEIRLGAGEADLDLAELNLQQLQLRTGAGSVEAALPGTLHELDVETGVGEVTLDLSVDWTQDLDAQIQGGIGELTVLLPADTGVRVNLSQGLGEADVEGLTQEGDFLVNDTYGETESTLELDIEGGVGSVELRVVERL